MKRGALALALAAALLLAACAAPPPPPPPPPPTERIVLLPNEDGRQSAVIVTGRGGAAVVLDTPYASAQLAGATAATAPAWSADAVKRRYATLLSVQPPRVRSYTLYFESNRAQLTADSQREVDRILAEASMVPAAEIDVIGHTDSTGTADYNDNLGRTRAQFVATLMAARGFERARLSAQTRGEREPLVPTRDGVDEPRNRRVEIRLR